jgi:stress 70 chaperone-associated protein
MSCFCRSNGSVLVGSRAVEQQEHNPTRTIYDAKRFIGRIFNQSSREFMNNRRRYPFQIDLDDNGAAYFVVPMDNNATKYVI